MDSLSNKQMIEHLSRFRDAGDKLSEDIYNISMRIFELISETEARENRSEGEEAMLSRLKQIVELLLSSALDSHNYNESMWKDYTKVIKALGVKTGDKSND
ncbi:hypothetical protein LDJ78_23945 [Citrobacter portucalensis]|uniref:hypothetical protein n=1 Tax=Citrobacter portucalensis TaxID=1639133 RepID=UPI001C63D533|nr:hypothetical protein [Citrobacter portucalensis]MBW7622343.1 hypothetical protein [Citrobacter portucalensis]MBW7641295.1 hypothetical protein [Citrobacter portucalensis]MCA2135821.1 hypothetical protein [Citrobacter portucalensis]MCA2145984.1 hypothetical protein [Citrobacter portucalensis]MCA2150779.1 hypothetical protein [Citrobacter portucalensis]